MEPLISFLSENYGISPDELMPESDVASVLGVDSLGLVTLGDRIQAEFGVELSATDLIECRTVGDFDDLLRRRADSEVAGPHGS